MALLASAGIPRFGPSLRCSNGLSPLWLLTESQTPSHLETLKGAASVLPAYWIILLPWHRGNGRPLFPGRRLVPVMLQLWELPMGYTFAGCLRSFKP